MEGRTPFCFLAAARSRQSHQRRQNHWKRAAADQQSGDRRFKAGSQQPANKSMAAKLARLIYRMLRYGTKYVDNGSRYYELQQRTREIRRLKLKAATLGFHLVQSTAA